MCDTGGVRHGFIRTGFSIYHHKRANDYRCAGHDAKERRVVMHQVRSM